MRLSVVVGDPEHAAGSRRRSLRVETNSVPLRSPRALVPNFCMNSPLELNSSTRWFSVSATQRLPAGVTAMPQGLLNWPLPEPAEPNWPRYSPASLNSLDAVVGAVDDPDVAFAVRGHAAGAVQLAGPRAGGAEGGEEGGRAFRGRPGPHLCTWLLPLSVTKTAPPAPKAIASRFGEVVVAGAGGAELGEVFAVGVELLDAVVALVDHDDVARRGDRDATWVAELAVARAGSRPSG